MFLASTVGRLGALPLRERIILSLRSRIEIINYEIPIRSSCSKEFLSFFCFRDFNWYIWPTQSPYMKNLVLSGLNVFDPTIM